MQNTKIDWADMTFNPVTGCLHGCEYCYARKIARRFGNKYMPFGNGLNNVLTQPVDGEHGIDPYPFGFEPTLHQYRLNQPAQIKKPQTIFVCSMADLFGEWVPDEWIQKVFQACEEAPQHRYLFLTKNSDRYCGYGNPLWKSLCSIGNTFIGATATRQSEVPKFDDAPARHGHFISIEPMLEPIDLRGLKYIHWVIIGAETGNRKGKVIPEKSWIDDIVRECRQHSIPIFMKESLRELMGDDFKQEFPWEVK